MEHYVIPIVWFVLGLIIGVQTKARETHIHYHGEPVETTVVDEENYNPSIADPDYKQWYDTNK